MKLNLARVVVALLVVALLSACGHSRVTRREGSRPAPPARTAVAPPRSGSYQVRAGDTLYGIAFRHGLDYREVAAWNRIPAPFTIYPGQRLSLHDPAVRTAATPSRRRSASASTANAPVSRAPSGPASRPDAAATSVTPLPPESSVGARPPGGSPAGSPPVARPAAAPAPVSAPPVATGAPAAVSPGGWRWPTQGQVIGRFVAGDPKRQGVDIAGTAGQAVVAASGGTVVYSGTGLVGYGELIIIKHSDEWLSAYAHNRKRLVAEGTAVQAGQPIAELGRTGTSRDMLHFEIRRNGKPIDPQTVLPRP